MANGFARLDKEKRIGFIGLMVAAALMVSMLVVIWVASRNLKSIQRHDSATPEQLAIYRAVLTSWMLDHNGQVNLITRVVAFDTAQLRNTACLKTRGFGSIDTARKIKLRDDDLAQIGLSGVVLLDQDSAMISLLPGTKSRDRRKPVKAEPEHPSSYVTLSDVAYDPQHQQAVVALGYSCADGCGLGKVVVLQKEQGAWRVADQCIQWIE